MEPFPVEWERQRALLQIGRHHGHRSQSKVKLERRMTAVHAMMPFNLKAGELCAAKR
jgi:hypothetical protein